MVIRTCLVLPVMEHLLVARNTTAGVMTSILLHVHSLVVKLHLTIVCVEMLHSGITILVDMLTMMV